jgi:hypothetical protein
MAAIKKKTKKTAAKKPAPRRKLAAKRKTTKKRPASSMKKKASEKPIGRVTHYYHGIRVAIVRFSKPIKKGSPTRFRGATTDFAQKLDSIQYNYKSLVIAPKGKQVGIKVKKRVREGDSVYHG